MGRTDSGRQAYAAVRVRLAGTLMRDLELFYDGQDDRFGRMVDSHGSSLGNPALWKSHVNEIAHDPDVTEFYPAQAAAFVKRMASVSA